MPDDLHDRDILAWSERQAELLRLAAGDPRHTGIDWSHVIEEIETVGTAQFNDARGLIRQAMMCLIGMHFDRPETARTEARIELVCLLDAAAEQCTPLMRQRIELAAMWSRIRARTIRERADDPLAQALPEHCPWRVDALLADEPDTLLAALAGWPAAPDTF